MNNKISKSYNIALIGAIALGITFLMAQLLDHNQYRRLFGVLGWAVNAPIILVGLLASIVSIRDFVNKKITFTQLLYALPMIIILIVLLFMMIVVLFN